MSEEPSIETMMLEGFLTAATPRAILRWHKAEMEKTIKLARGAEREAIAKDLRERFTKPFTGISELMAEVLSVIEGEAC